MKVLVVGSGGREHAIAWKINQSPLLTHLYIAPGNAGMADLGELVHLAVEDADGITWFALQNKIDLVVIGPEAALAAGVSDALREKGIAVFGPSRYAAQMESSKRFSKQFMQSHGIPTAGFAVFSDYEQACLHLKSINYPFVIKASGLAAGKGVFLPNNVDEGLDVLRGIMLDRQFGTAGDEVLIEERLEGEEVSLLAFCDGKTIVPMPPAQDHKRLLDNDEGPNTGGMGAYAPAPVLPMDQIAEMARLTIQPVVDGLRDEGHPYVGVLYTGLMLTKDGPKVLEYNARFGDPETQAILPLLKSDLLSIFLACTRGELDKVEIKWADKAVVCVALVSGGYPEHALTGFPINGLEQKTQDSVVFHAGTRQESGKLVNAGGRVLGVTSWDDDLPKAIDRAYRAVSQISFEGMHFRRDIGKKGLKRLNQSAAYQAAGVDIDAGNRAVRLMKNSVRATYTSRVLAGIGSFGGLFDASNLGDQPVLVASTDGVGTKVELAARLGRYHGIGQDIVNHCIDDILVQGAHPLFFLDYFATAKLKPEVVAEIVSGMAEACKSARCVLLGGETAEMPGVYRDDTFDVAGTIVGIVQRDRILPKQADMKSGDILVGFASSGPHTNGYSLIRQICEGLDLYAYNDVLKSSLADALLAPHRSYLSLIEPVLPFIKGLSHITGGGFIENIPRMLPEGLQAIIDRSAWPKPALFSWLQEQGKIDPQEMYRVFNMGIGLVAVVHQDDWAAIQAEVNEPVWRIGELRSGPYAEVVFK
jgi:phosphoribosylamine--glycine ligase / phosphoribosylformylglycinamidine cyclo-ligase